MFFVFCADGQRCERQFRFVIILLIKHFFLYKTFRSLTHCTTYIWYILLQFLWSNLLCLCVLMYIPRGCVWALSLSLSIPLARAKDRAEEGDSARDRCGGGRVSLLYFFLLFCFSFCAEIAPYFSLEASIYVRSLCMRMRAAPFATIYYRNYCLINCRISLNIKKKIILRFFFYVYMAILNPRGQNWKQCHARALSLR